MPDRHRGAASRCAGGVVRLPTEAGELLLSSASFDIRPEAQVSLFDEAQDMSIETIERQVLARFSDLLEMQLSTPKGSRERVSRLLREAVAG